MNGYVIDVWLAIAILIALISSLLMLCLQMYAIIKKDELIYFLRNELKKYRL